MNNAIFRLLCRSVVTAGLLTWLTLSRDINWSEMLERLAGIHPLSLVASVVAVGASHVLAIASVRQLLKSRGFEVRFALLLANHVRGLLAAQFLPTPVAGDIVRIHDLHSRRSMTAEVTVDVENEKPLWQSATWALTVQRILNLFGSLVIFVVTVRVAHIDDLARLNTAATLTLLTVSGIFIVVVASPRVASRQLLARALNWVPPPGVVFQTLALGIAQQLALIAAVVVLASGLGISVPASRLTAMVPLSLLAVILPVSINGLGLRESVYVFVLSPAGVSDSAAVTLSLSVFGLALAFSLLGLLTPGATTASRRGEKDD